MNFNPLDYVRSALHGDVLNETLDANAELTPDESGATNDSEHATDHRPRRLLRRPADPKPNVNTLHDLELLMQGFPHLSVREGVEQGFISSQMGSAVLFEARKIDSGPFGATQVRYLPLVNKGAKTSPQPASETAATPQARPRAVRHAPLLMFVPSPSTEQTLAPTVPMAKDRPLDISHEAKSYIDRARAQRSLDGVVTGNSRASSNTTRIRLLSLGSNTTPAAARQWPAGEIPVELFETITETLSHRDIRNMRLVCKEFESKTSGILFKEVVVPFTAELYDMIEDDVSARLSSQLKSGSNRQTVARALPSRKPDSHYGNGMYYRSTVDTATRHGLRVFEGFGPHMNKFGIRLEVTEADLSMATWKSSNTKYVEAYHGGYDWPPPGYARFSRLAGLEKTADETPRMTAALASLVNVREIGLSLDSGLGVLGGPDRSHYDMIFDRSAAVFEESDLSQRPTSSGVEDLWSHLLRSHSSFTTGVQLGQERLVSCILASLRNGPVQLPTVASATEYDDSTLWPSFETDGIFSGVDLATPINGVIYTTSADPCTKGNFARPCPPPLSPANLTSEQKQWILETGWAQSAFLDTYILALGDNPQIFHQITKVTISKISSGLLTKLDRDAFWAALPNVKDVTLLVIPDWRMVCKDEAGCAVTHPLAPSLAVATLLAVTRRIAFLDEIKRLRIGYAQGGENAKGMFGRNNNLMPAPIAAPDQFLVRDPELFPFDHLESLTLVNCWISPPALVTLASIHTVASVMGKTLTLESVSMTATTRLELQAYLQVNDELRQQFRQGCWPWVIEDLKLYLRPVPREPSPYDTPSSKPQFGPASYKKITFDSCGYAVLPNHDLTFDQSAIELGSTMVAVHYDADLTIHSSEWFRHRAEQLRPHMQTSKDAMIGRVVPWMNLREVAALRTWRMRVGLPAGEGQDAEYDGLPTRGTGRFWGSIREKAAMESFCVNDDEV